MRFCKIGVVLLSGFWLVFVLASCAPVSILGIGSTPLPTQQTENIGLTVYATRTPRPAVLLVIPASATPQPTETPVVYVIAQDDTLIGIAKKFSTTVDALLSANPGLVPQSLSIGQSIRIPAGKGNADLSLLVTPAALESGEGLCRAVNSGTECLVPVHNPNDYALESVGLRITLFDGQGQALASQEALLPLNIFPAGALLPVPVFFRGYWGAYALGEIRTALNLEGVAVRSLQTETKDLLVVLDWNGVSARVQGRVALVDAEKPAKQVWVLAVAYDSAGQPVGFGRWEAAGSLKPGEELPFDFLVYSLGPMIDHIDVLVEARP